MNGDERDQLAQLIKRRGLRAVLADIAAYCDQEAELNAEDGNFQIERNWKRYADLFNAIAALTPRQNFPPN